MTIRITKYLPENWELVIEDVYTPYLFALHANDVKVATGYVHSSEYCQIDPDSLTITSYISTNTAINLRISSVLSAFIHYLTKEQEGKIAELKAIDERNRQKTIDAATAAVFLNFKPYTHQE